MKNFDGLKTFVNKHKYDPVVGGLSVLSVGQAVGIAAAGVAVATGVCLAAAPLLTVCGVMQACKQKPDEATEEIHEEKLEEE